MGVETAIMVGVMAVAAAGTMYSQGQMAKEQSKTNSAIAARYAEEERKRREGTAMDKALAEEIEGRRQERMRSNRDEVDQMRDFTNVAGEDSEDLRQGVRIATEAPDVES
jgi:hypothetical protein